MIILHKLNKKYSKIILLGFIASLIFLILGLLAYTYFNKEIVKEIKVNLELNPIPNSSERTEEEEPVVKETEAPVTAELPESKNLVIPYAAQAPFSNWEVHEESCEEAALVMIKEYLEGISYANNRIPEGDLDTIFRQMKSWQVSNYGEEPDLTMSALGEFAKSYYGYTPHFKKGITENDIKLAISLNNPVLVPVMTHSLENNMYGPLTTYHVLLIKGYDANGVYTNDAGVGNGPNHFYSWPILWQAIDAQSTKMGVGREMLYLTKD